MTDPARKAVRVADEPCPKCGRKRLAVRETPTKYTDRGPVYATVCTRCKIEVKL